MEQEEIKKAIIERFNNLQPEIQEAIMDSNYEKNLYDVGKKYNLTIEQMGELEFNTTLVMLGQTHPDDYNKELLEDLKIPEEKINLIVSDINEIVLKPIRELLKKNFEEDNRVESELEETPIPPYKKIIQEESINNANINKEIISKPEPLKIPEQPKAPEGIVFETPTPKEAVQEILKTVAPIKTIEEKKPAMVIHNIFEDKLKEPTTSKHSVSNYSIPDSTKSTPKTPETIEKNTAKITTSTDPYREAF